MSQTTSPESNVTLIQELRAFVGVCEELLQLAVQEHQALSGQAEFQPDSFHGTRKGLLTRLSQVLLSIKNWRKAWQKDNPGTRGHNPEARALLEVLQQMIVKILQLDRENQQALLRRGLVPAREVLTYAPKPPSFVSKLYSRHTS